MLRLLISVGSHQDLEQKSVPEAVELDRVLPVLHALVSEKLDVPISIDTTKASVAQYALEAGAHIINDITALHGDNAMAQVVADMEAGVILMHMKGDTPYDAKESTLSGCYKRNI